MKVSLWCLYGVVTAVCVSRIQRRWKLPLWHVLLGRSHWRLKEGSRQMLVRTGWVPPCLRHCQFVPRLHKFTHPADIDMNEASDEILTIDEVAAYLKAGRRTVYRLAANGQIPAFKLGGTWRFRRTELDRWIASRIDTHGHSKSDGVEK